VKKSTKYINVILQIKNGLKIINIRNCYIFMESCDLISGLNCIFPLTFTEVAPVKYSQGY